VLVTFNTIRYVSSKISKGENWSLGRGAGIALDILIYAVLPLFVWGRFHNIHTQYLAVAISSLLGLAYTVYRFIESRELNATGVYIFVSNALGVVVTVGAGNAHNMLWGQSAFNVVLALFALGTNVWGRPLASMFAIDFAYLRGVPRERSRHRFRQRSNKRYFTGVTYLMVLLNLFQTTVLIYMTIHLGYAKFPHIVAISNIVGWVGSGVITVSLIWVMVRVYKRPISQQSGESI
jgi:hypothetical protein